MEDQYTLKDEIFRYGVTEGANSEHFFEDNQTIMVVGGASVQLNNLDNPELWRPTTDIDFIINKPSGKDERRRWAKGLAGTISAAGRYSATGGLTRFGSEVRFSNLPKDFILHFDCLSRKSFDQHKNRIDSEYGRAQETIIDGKFVRYNSKMDIILNKILRLKRLEYYGSFGLNDSQKDFLSLLCDGQFDDALGVYRGLSLDKILAIRNQTVEDLGRFGIDQVMQEIEKYKAAKDTYDIVTTLDAAERQKQRISRSEFKSELKSILV